MCFLFSDLPDFLLLSGSSSFSYKIKKLDFTHVKYLSLHKESLFLEVYESIDDIQAHARHILVTLSICPICTTGTNVQLSSGAITLLYKICQAKRAEIFVTHAQYSRRHGSQLSVYDHNYQIILYACYFIIKKMILGFLVKMFSELSSFLKYI